jgi:DNA-binding transcriptional LysR family regulator
MCVAVKAVIAGKPLLIQPHTASIVKPSRLRQITCASPAYLPISVLYPHNRHMSPRVRVFVDWMGEVFAKAQ